METLDLVVSSGLMLLFCLAMIGGIVMKLLYRRLRVHHYQTWFRLGEPSLFVNASMRANEAMARFLWERGEENLGDSALGRLATTARALALAGATLFLVTMGLFLVLLWLKA